MKIVYHSFEGRYSDSPAVIHRALAGRDGLEHVWLADERHRHGFPVGAETREWGTPQAREALESADLIVANTHTDVEWAKKPGAFYLQTWHGTPLKRIHWDVLWAPPGRLERLDRDVAQWDLLVSPNHMSTGLLRQAFRYEGAVAECGYPRNDILTGPQAPAVRGRVREQLGLREGQRAILYTPTWRDDAVFDEGGAAFALGLDPERVVQQLAGEGVVLLLRLHYTLTGRLGDVSHPALRDVSFHPDISELYLAADAMVTDYSSTMFDFAVTGKPQLLYTYDLEDYRGRLRGFYFDLEDLAPGPLLHTEDELVGALKNLEAVSEAHRSGYERFRREFCHLEDGRATERVLAALPLPA